MVKFFIANLQNKRKLYESCGWKVTISNTWLFMKLLQKVCRIFLPAINLEVIILFPYFAKKLIKPYSHEPKIIFKLHCEHK